MGLGRLTSFFKKATVKKPPKPVVKKKAVDNAADGKADGKAGN